MSFYFHLKTPLSISCKAGIVVMNFLNFFCLSGEDFISPSSLKDTLLSMVFSSENFFLSALQMYHLICPDLQVFCWEICSLSNGNPLIYDLMLFSCCFWNSLFVFSFWQLVVTQLGEDLFEINLFGNFGASWIWMFISLPKLGKFSAIISLYTLSAHLSLLPVELP